MIELQTVRNATETLEEIVNFGEMTAQLDQRHNWKRTLRIHLKQAFSLREQIAHDEQQIAGRLHRQEAASGHVNADGAIEALNGGTRCSLELNHIHSFVGSLETYIQKISYFILTFYGKRSTRV